jgi:multidrug resistance efflux pump
MSTDHESSGAVPRRAVKVIAGAGAGLVVLVATSWYLFGGQRAGAEGVAAPAPPAPKPAIEIATCTAGMQDLPVFLSVNGSLFPYESADVAPQTSGMVVEVPHDAGASVRRGELLVRLDDRDARMRVQRAEAGLAQSMANLKQARAALGIDGNGALDPTRVAEVEAARTQKELAESTERRFAQLLQTGVISQWTYDDAHAQAETARRQYESALARAKQGGAGIDVAASQVESARAELALARKALEDTVIRSPFDGQIAERHAAPGEWVTPQTHLMRIVQSHVLKLVLLVSEADAGRIRLGMPVTLTVDSFPDRQFAGNVSAILPALDAASRSLQVVVGVRNPEALLRPGMFVSGRIVEELAGRRGVVVPRTAVRTASGSHVLFVLNGDRVDRRIVQLGQEAGELVHVVSGLQEGERVATSRLDDLSDGAAVVAVGN